MKYNEKIIEKISDEIQKVPNIRYVCKKVGINHSTFYRWMMKHEAFYREITGALVMGREHMNDAAESVIIKGIQDGDYRSATYWLSHNSDRYIGVERVKYHQYLEKNTLSILKEVDEDSVFEILFSVYYFNEKEHGIRKARKSIEPMVSLACSADEDLIELFYSAYIEWKTNKENLEKKQIAVKKRRDAIDASNPVRH